MRRNVAVAELRREYHALHEEFLCPIEHLLMRDPVVISDGSCYSREAIQRWLKDHDTSPMTGLRLPNRDVRPNARAARAVQRVRAIRGLIGEPNTDDESEDGHTTYSNSREDPLDPDEFLQAVKDRNVARCQALLGSAQSLPGLNAQDGFGISAMGLAIHFGLVEVCHGILARPDFDANAKDHLGATALHYAAFHGLADVCQGILARPDFTEAMARAPGWWNETAREVAARQGHAGVVRALDAVARGRPR